VSSIQFAIDLRSLSLRARSQSLPSRHDCYNRRLIRHPRHHPIQCIDLPLSRRRLHMVGQIGSEEAVKALVMRDGELQRKERRDRRKIGSKTDHICKRHTHSTVEFTCISSSTPQRPVEISISIPASLSSCRSRPRKPGNTSDYGPTDGLFLLRGKFSRCGLGGSVRVFFLRGWFVYASGCVSR
jgi:hypothetical protein